MDMAASSDSARRVYLQEGMGTWMWWCPFGGGKKLSHVSLFLGTWPGSTSKNSHPFFLSRASPYVGWSCSENQSKPDLSSLDLWWQVGARDWPHVRFDL